MDPGLFLPSTPPFPSRPQGSSQQHLSQLVTGFPFSQHYLQPQNYRQGWEPNPHPAAFAGAHTPWGPRGSWLSRGQGRRSGVGRGRRKKWSTELSRAGNAEWTELWMGWGQDVARLRLACGRGRCGQDGSKQWGTSPGPPAGRQAEPPESQQGCYNVHQ